MWFAKKTFSSPLTRRSKLRIEELESRFVPYSLSGNAWPGAQLVTLSFMPDGTDLGGIKSNLFASMNGRFGSPETWQGQIIKAAQVYAKHTNLNFMVVPDNGAPSGSGAYQQGDSNFGDIRIGGYNFGSQALAYAFAPPPVNNYSIAGDVAFNTAQPWNIGTTYDLFTVASHEIGHALGLQHSTVTYATMYSAYTGVRTGIDWDDIYGIRSIYSGGEMRTGDWNDVSGGGNESFATATDITLHIQADLTVLRLNRDITTNADVDFFKVTIPAGSTESIQIAAQSSGLSLLTSKVTVYAADQKTVLGSSDNLGKSGQSSVVTLTNKGSAGDVIYVKVQSADSTPFSTGKYAISMSFGDEKLPAQESTNTKLANGNPISSGGGLAMVPRMAASPNSDSDRSDGGNGCGCPACQAAARIAKEAYLGSAKASEDAVTFVLATIESVDTTGTGHHAIADSVELGKTVSAATPTRLSVHGLTVDPHDVLDLCLMSDLVL